MSEELLESVKVPEVVEAVNESVERNYIVDYDRSMRRQAVSAYKPVEERSDLLEKLNDEDTLKQLSRENEVKKEKLTPEEKRQRSLPPAATSMTGYSALQVRL